MSSHPRPVALLMLIALALPTSTAWSQDRAVQERLERLERDLSMLQRQVYRGAPPQVLPVGSTSAVDIELRMDRLETQMRELTGRMEDTANQVEQLRRRLEQINSDVDLRFNQGPAPGPGQPKGTGSNSHPSPGTADSGVFALRAPLPPASPARPRPQGELMPPGTLVPPPPDLPPGAGSLTPPAAAAPRVEQATAAGTTVHPQRSGLSGGSVPDQYNAAFGLLKQADYPAAEEALKEFVTQHPNDPLAGSAQYWLGETYFARGRYTEAAAAFAEGYKNYPHGGKAADDLLKLGMSLARANQKQNACIAFSQLDHDFQHPGSAIKERAMAEKKRLGC